MVRKQSIAKKRKFADSEWKKMWYSARWGEGYVPKSKQRELQKRVSEVPLDVLQVRVCEEQTPCESSPLRLASFIALLTLNRFLSQSPELAGLSDDEVNEAVRVYLAANDKRGKKTAERHQFGYSDWHKKRNEDAKSIAER